MATHRRAPHHVASLKGVIADEVRFERASRASPWGCRRAASGCTCNGRIACLATSRYSAERAQEFYRCGDPYGGSGTDRSDGVAAPAREEQRAASERFTVLFVGRFYRRKRVEILLRAAAALRGSIPELEVRLVGSGPCGPRLRQLSSELKLDGTVTFLGDVSRSNRWTCSFSPKTVAVIGATETANTVGRTLLWNLVTSPSAARSYPVNPKRPSVLGVKAYKSFGDPGGGRPGGDRDAAALDSRHHPGVRRENGVRGAIVISAGFKEIGPEGAELERQILAEAQAAGIRVIGPNCLGVMSPLHRLNATFATTIARPGSVGFISQSGALCTAVLDWSLRKWWASAPSFRSAPWWTWAGAT
jgi:glycosyltransferase involved in cell wall biosynthesis